MKKFLSNFAGITVLSSEEQVRVRGGYNNQQPFCKGMFMPCEENAHCPDECGCIIYPTGGFCLDNASIDDFSN